MAPVVRVAVVALAVAALAACGGGDGGSPTTTSTGTPTTAVPEPSDGATTPGTDGTTAAPTVPTTGELAGYLVTPSDLGPDWNLWEGFSAWPDGAPGAVPDDQRAVIPSLPMCPNAGEAAVTLAARLQWQAFTQLHLATPDPFANMVVVQQLLLADDPDATAATFATLRDGLTSCLTRNLPEGEWEIGLRESLTVPAVGEDRYAERSSSVDPGGARQQTRLVLVRDGEVLMAILLDDVLITPDAEPVLTDEAFDAVVTGIASRLPG